MSYVSYLRQLPVVNHLLMAFNVGATPKKAELALELAIDTALVRQMAEVFGGLDYMTDRAREFIENWEIESYRSRQVS